MAAAAFKVVMTVAYCDGRGREVSRATFPLTVSDVTAAYYIYPDGAGDTILSPSYPIVKIVDVALSAAGTDTSQAQIFVNGKDSGEKILNSLNLTTTIVRQFQNAPMSIAGGSRLAIRQLT